MNNDEVLSNLVQDQGKIAQREGKCVLMPHQSLEKQICEQQTQVRKGGV